MASTTYYAVGKITSYEIDNQPQQLTTNTDTVDGQQVKVYVIGYRDLEPILSLSYYDEEILFGEEN